MNIMNFGRHTGFVRTKGLKERIQEAEKEIQMRQYRGLTKEGKWVYGWYLHRHESDWDGHDKYIHQIHTKEWNEFIEVIPETVGQSIVVEGKEFYEGDVTKDDTDDIGVVRFGKLPLDKSGDCVCVYPAFYVQCFGQLGQAPTYACQQLGDWMEIIGTIHTTHPELLEQQ